jgi:hypothetical protein
MSGVLSVRRGASLAAVQLEDVRYPAHFRDKAGIPFHSLLDFLVSSHTKLILESPDRFRKTPSIARGRTYTRKAVLGVLLR